MSCRWLLLALGTLLGFSVPLASAADKPRGPAVLAGSVPPDARLFLELADVHTFLKSRAGREFADLLAGLMPHPDTRPATQPASGWQRVLGEKLGLRNPKAARLLFTGRLALAADGWNQIGDAILLAEPPDPAALETELQAHRIPETANAKVRRYRLEGDHELSCDGRTVVVGRRTNAAGLFLRTFALWTNDRRVTLANVVDFRERITALPTDSQIVFYSGQGTAVPATRPGANVSFFWPEVRSLAVGVVMNGHAVTVETSAKLAAESPPKDADPPIHALLHVPASTLVAWTRPIRYAEEFRRIDASYPDGAIRFYLDVLQTGLPPGTLESRLLNHLVGDSILMVGLHAWKASPGGSPEPSLLLPVAALAVETDDPDAVSGVLAHIEQNLLRLLNLQPPKSGPLTISETPLAPSGPAIRSLPLGQFFSIYTECEFLSSLEISWTVADRWLVIATHPEMVRQIVEVRRGAGQPVPVDGFHQALARVKTTRGIPQMALIARPGAAAKMIDSWEVFIKAHHPEMLKPDWWQRLRRRQLANGVQLGIVPRPTTQPGVLVGRTLPGWPAYERLRPDDQILAVDGREVDARRPLASLRELMANRQKADAVTLRIRRSGQEITVQVPMLTGLVDPPPIQPFELLANLADLLRVFSSASYIAWQPAKDLVSARLELELSGPASKPAVPHLAIMTTGPTTAPATAPAPTTAPARATAPATAPAPAPASAPANPPAPATTAPATQPAGKSAP